MSSNYQIIGDDGTVFSPEEAQLLALQSAYSAGTLDPGAFVGAAGSLMTRPRAAVSPSIMAAMSAAMEQARSRGGSMFNLMPGTGPRVVPAGPGPLREVVQGLTSASIAAGASADITFNATMEFRPTRLMIGESIASLFVITDIKVGSDSLFLASGAVPGEVFGLNSVGASALKRRSAPPGTPVTVSVTNIDGAAHTFRGAIFGEGVDTSQCRV